MKRLLGYVLALAFLCSPTLALASGETQAAGPPGARPYNTTFLVSGTYTTKSSPIYLTGCGAGAGGGGGHTADPGGGGGGGSGAQCIIRMPVYLPVGTVLTITIGTAGVGAAAGASGGIVNLDTIIGGLPIGTYTLMGGRPATVGFGSVVAPAPGTVSSGGTGGGTAIVAGGAGTSGAGGLSGSVSHRQAGGDNLAIAGTTGAGGGGPSNVGGLTQGASGYANTSSAAAAASGTKGGGGHGGNSALGAGAAGGSNAVGANCTIGYGAAGGGGAATFAGGNGCPGKLEIEETY